MAAEEQAPAGSAKQRKRAGRSAERSDHERQLRKTLRAESRELTLLIALGTLAPGCVLGAAFTLLPLELALVVVAGTALVVFLRLRDLGERVHAQEQAYLASLPFTVDGYFEAIGIRPSGSCTVLMELRFRNVSVDEQIASESAAAMGAAVQSYGRQLVRVRGPVLDCSVNDGEDNNRPVLRYLRRALEQVALPLHAISALEQVSFERS